MRTMIALPLAALLAACGSNSSGGGGSSNEIKVVGSSTVYPFTKAVAEDFQRVNPGINVIVELTGTGAGMKLFCGGVGSQFPDIEDASRAIKKSEFDDCQRNGAKQVIEIAGRDRRPDDHRIEQRPGDEPDPGRYLQGARRQPVRQGAEHRRRPGGTSIRRFRRSRSASSARRRPRAPATASPSSTSKRAATPIRR